MDNNDFIILKSLSNGNHLSHNDLIYIKRILEDLNNSLKLRLQNDN